jgi:hypothetical protein
MVRILGGVVLAFSAAVLLFLAGTGFTTQRYEVDFLPAMVLVALVAAGIHIGRGKGLPRAPLCTVLILAIAWGVVANLALGITGPFDEILKNRPANYLRIARWFSPIEQYRPMKNPAIRIAFTAEFKSYTERVREPLLTMGRQAYRYLLYAEHSAGKLQLGSWTENSTVVQPLADRDDVRTDLQMAFAPETGKLTITANGHQVLVHDLGTWVTAPAEITIGENRIEPGVTKDRFTGRIYGIVRSVQPTSR